MPRAQHRINEQIDAAPVKAHMAYLREHGVTYTAIAMELGLTPQAIAYTAHTAKRIRRGAAEGILALTKDLAFTPEKDERFRKGDSTKERGRLGPRVPRHGSRRRVQALQRMGYTLLDLSERVGFNLENFQHPRRGIRCSRQRHEAIKVLYDQLWNVPGPSNSARLRAIRKGYALPMAWDDIDDPKDYPKGQIKIKLDKPKYKPKGRTADRATRKDAA